MNRVHFRTDGARLLRGVLPGLLALTAACSGGDADRALVGFIAPEGPRGASVRRGAELGAAEAAHAGELIGRSLRLETEAAGSPEEAEAAARRLLGRGAFALVGGYDEESCRALADLAEREGVLFVNVGCRSDAARRERRAHTFHVEASDSMYRALRPVPGADASPVLWHAGLTRYGAAQLNERFLRQKGAPADPSGWAGWMAVKVLWEAVLRTGSTDAAALASYLSADSARFDGHKGEPLRFDPATHRLRQPVSLASAAAPSGGEGGPGAPALRGAPVRLDGDAYAFVSDEGSGDVSVVDAATLRVLHTIPVGDRPWGVAILER